MHLKREIVKRTFGSSVRKTDRSEWITESLSSNEIVPIERTASFLFLQMNFISLLSSFCMSLFSLTMLFYLLPVKSELFSLSEFLNQNFWFKTQTVSSSLKQELNNVHWTSHCHPTAPSWNIHWRCSAGNAALICPNSTAFVCSWTLRFSHCCLVQSAFCASYHEMQSSAA